MSPYDSPSSSPPASPRKRRIKNCARKCERACCILATYFPLAFIYGLSTWAVWVESGIGLRGSTSDKTPSWSTKALSILGIALYLLLNSSYTVAVFRDPGSPMKSSTATQRGKYSVLPTSEPAHDFADVQTITVSSSGGSRYCKKCQTPKPDRTHHCSTCKRCVLKMDHHCPWLATCLGLHNYKAFVLFLVYVSMFCCICFINSGWWVWTEIFESRQYLEEFAPINVILLAVLSGILGLVLTGFTSWHLYLCIRGQTTIECLEQTRYLSGVRKQVERARQDQRHAHENSEGLTGTLQRAGDQILEFHANAVPGASRFEEGEEHSSPTPSLHNQSTPHSDSPAQRALRRTYSSIEEQRERDRYEAYLDDQDSEKLPNAFDLGWRKNLSHIFGPNPLLWFLPICNTTGDGWRWEVSQKWIQASEEVAKRKEQRLRETMHHNNSQRMGIRGGGGGGAGDLENGNVYSRSAMSMDTLRPGHALAKPKQRRDWDRAGTGAETESFEVSTDEDTDDAWEDGRSRPVTDGRERSDEWRSWD